MVVEFITKEDLRDFRSELLNDLKKTFSQHLPDKRKQWLKSSEVRRMLKVSPGTLQNLRINGTLRFTKIGGTMYYSYDDIETLLDSGMKGTIPSSLAEDARRQQEADNKSTPSPLERAGVRPTLTAL